MASIFLARSVRRCIKNLLPKATAEGDTTRHLSSPHGECRRVYNQRQDSPLVGEEAWATRVTSNRKPGLTSRLSAFVWNRRIWSGRLRTGQPLR